MQWRSLTIGRVGPAPPQYLAPTIVKVGFGPPNIKTMTTPLQWWQILLEEGPLYVVN